MTGYLVDTSALVRLLRRQTDPGWSLLVERGLVSLCDPVLAESLTIADAKRYDAVERAMRDAYPWVPVPEDAWTVIAKIRRALARHSAHQGLSVADYLVIATALAHQLTVLHEDADFETAGRLLPELRHQRISATPPT